MPDSELSPLIQALLRPDAYPHPVGKVELRQTHISYVLLAGDFVYKIKKAVDFGFLDYSTVSRRRYYCRREVAFNRRLCSDTYLGVVPICESGGRYIVSGPGPAVEYAVHMRRLPEDRMMHHLLEREEVTVPMVQAVADKLSAFHRRAASSPAIARYGDWAIRFNQRENEEQWQPFIGRTITPEQDRILIAYREAFLARRAAVMRRRVEEQRIRHVHSDLRSDAVCFTDPARPADPDAICIFDCVEFNRRIYQVDVARDVSFLGMDLEYRGHPDLARAFVERYKAVAGDPDIGEVLDFFACYNACVRGKVEGFLLNIPQIPAPEKRRARDAARRYFDLACGYARSLPPALLVITCGLPASGKSTVARALAEEAGFERLSSDLVRKEIAGIAPTERRYEGFEAGLYARESTEGTYRALLERVRPLLLEGRNVVVDASFIRREHRRAAARLARETGAQFACLEFEISDAEARRRLEERARAGGDPSDARWEIYPAQKRRFQKPSEIAAFRRVRLDSTGRLRIQVRTALTGLRNVSPLSVA